MLGFIIMRVRGEMFHIKNYAKAPVGQVFSGECQHLSIFCVINFVTTRTEQYCNGWRISRNERKVDCSIICMDTIHSAILFTDTLTMFGAMI